MSRRAHYTCWAKHKFASRSISNRGNANKSRNVITTTEAAAISHDVGSRKYPECFCLTGEGVDDILETATRAIVVIFEEREFEICSAII